MPSWVVGRVRQLVRLEAAPFPASASILRGSAFLSHPAWASPIPPGMALAVYKPRDPRKSPLFQLLESVYVWMACCRVLRVKRRCRMVTKNAASRPSGKVVSRSAA